MWLLMITIAVVGFLALCVVVISVVIVVVVLKKHRAGTTGNSLRTLNFIVIFDKRKNRKTDSNFADYSSDEEQHSILVRVRFMAVLLSLKLWAVVPRVPLHHLLPKKTDHSYSLRSRSHNFELTHTHDNRNFIGRMLFYPYHIS